MTCLLRRGVGADGQTDRQPCTRNQNKRNNKRTNLSLNEQHNQAHRYEIQVWGFKDSISV